MLNRRPKVFLWTCLCMINDACAYEKKQFIAIIKWLIRILVMVASLLDIVMLCWEHL